MEVPQITYSSLHLLCVPYSSSSAFLSIFLAAEWSVLSTWCGCGLVVKEGVFDQLW